MMCGIRFGRKKSQILGQELKTLFEKIMELARQGRGRRLLNSLSSKTRKLPAHQVDRILELYRDKGLPIELEQLKKHRGILTDKQYETLAQDVRDNCSCDRFKNFASALRKLLSSGMTMNPAKME